MKKVYQTIINKNNGDCMQACIASLFELELNEVPNFIKLGDRWFNEMNEIYKERGRSHICCITKKESIDTEFLKRIAKFDGGINGYLYASVPSQTFSDVGHAVVIDLDLNIVHDPNLNQLALKLKPEDVIDIMISTDLIIGKTGGIWKADDYWKLSEEERNKNCWN
jgi:hypothetical protein